MKIFCAFLLFVGSSRGYAVSDEALDGLVFPDEVLRALEWATDPRLLQNRIEVAFNATERQSGCVRDLLRLLKGVLTIRPWALLMMDATAKLPPGLLRGHGAALGSFDECLKVQDRNNTIRGKYCLGSIVQFDISHGISLARDTRIVDLPKKSVKIPWGACLPDSCTSRHFQLLYLNLIKFSEESCQTMSSQYSDFDTADRVAIIVLSVIAALMVVSTLYDVLTYYFYNGEPCLLLRSFSIITNGANIITVKRPKEDISCIYGLRVLSMLFLMYGYSYILFVLSPLVNWLDMLRWITNRNTAIIIEAAVCADTFFVISGVLVCYNYFRAKERGPEMNELLFHLRFCLNRILRLTPALAMAVLVHATLLRHMGSGPVWPHIRDAWLVNNCRESWWSTLLYVQNYVNPDLTTICIPQIWYLSVEMQLFMASPFILFLLSKHPRYTLSVMLTILVGSMLLSFVEAWTYDLKAVIATNRSYRDLNNYVRHYYFPTHTRASSWIIGFFFGYFLYVTKKAHVKIMQKQKVNKFVVYLLLLTSLASLLFCIMIGRELIGLEFSWIRHAFYITFIRPLWALATGWIVFVCAHGYAGEINSLLSAPIFEVLYRISYSTYLVNLSLMFFLQFQTRYGYEFTDWQAFYDWLGYILPCLFLGLVWTLAFESPFIVITKALFYRKEGRQK